MLLRGNSQEAMLININHPILDADALPPASVRPCWKGSEVERRFGYVRVLAGRRAR